jgi:predicted transcriptional regulator
MSPATIRISEKAARRLHELTTNRLGIDPMLGAVADEIGRALSALDRKHQRSKPRLKAKAQKKTTKRKEVQP